MAGSRVGRASLERLLWVQKEAKASASFEAAVVWAEVGAQPADGISDCVVISSFVAEDSTKCANDNAPAEDTLSVELGHFMGQFLVVTVDKNVVPRSRVRKVRRVSTMERSSFLMVIML